jgi:hypothetical protein
MRIKTFPCFYTIGLLVLLYARGKLSAGTNMHRTNDTIVKLIDTGRLSCGMYSWHRRR